jgi:integrase/recombinase XerD
VRGWVIKEANRGHIYCHDRRARSPRRTAGRDRTWCDRGFLAGYTGTTLISYTTDLRLFVEWCIINDVRVFEVRRAHLEIFGRTMEADGRMRSTVARRLSTLGSFYRYCHVEGILQRNPAANVRRPKVNTESRTLGLDRNEPGGLLVQAGLGSARDHALISLLALNGLRISEALGADIESMDMDRGHRTLAIVRKGGKHVIIPLAHAPAERWTCTSTNAPPGRSSSVRTGNGWTATPPTGP